MFKKLGEAIEESDHPYHTVKNRHKYAGKIVPRFHFLGSHRQIDATGGLLTHSKTPCCLRNALQKGLLGLGTCHFSGPI